MPNCKNKIKKKQIVWVPYTTDDNEFCTISPGGQGTPTLDDYILLEDDSNSGQKFCATLGQIKELFSNTGLGVDTFNFGETAQGLKDKFLIAGDNQNRSNESAPLACEDGEVQKITISSDGTDAWILDVVINAVTGGGGTYSGGTLIGSVTKPSGQTDIIIDVAGTGFDFSQNDRISAYVRKVAGDPASSAAKPLVRLYAVYS